MGFIVFAIFIILFDQASKFYIQHNMYIGESIPVIEGIFHITYIENPYTAFGLFKYQTIFFVIAANFQKRPFYVHPFNACPGRCSRQSY
jgi:signal peptidase II